ncbi:aminotransferase, partial [Streptomyces lydicus]
MPLSTDSALPAPGVHGAAPSPGPDLRHHGDAEVRAADGGGDLTDLAVNVRTGTPPAWLKARIAASLDSLAAYP